MLIVYLAFCESAVLGTLMEAMLRSMGLAVFVMAISGFSASAADVSCEGNEENLQVYLDMTRVLFNERDTARVGEFYADVFLSHNTEYSAAGPQERSVAYMERLWGKSKEAEPVRRLTNNLVICREDFVIAQVTVEGVRVKGPMEGDPEEGRPYRMSAIDIYRFADGKVVERWGNSDKLTMIRQTGLQFDMSYQPLKEAPKETLPD